MERVSGRSRQGSGAGRRAWGQAWLRCSGWLSSAEASAASSIVQIARCHKPQALYEAGRAVVTAMDVISGKGTKAVQGLGGAGRMTAPSAKRPGKGTKGHPRRPVFAAFQRHCPGPRSS